MTTEEELYLRLHASGGDQVAHEVDKGTDAVKRAGRESDKSTSNIDKFATGMGGMVTPISAAVAVLLPFLPAVGGAITGLGLLSVAAGGAGLAFGVLAYGVKNALGVAAKQQAALEAAQINLQHQLQSGDAKGIASAQHKLLLIQKQVNAEGNYASKVAGTWNNVQQAMKDALQPGVQQVFRGLLVLLNTVGKAVGHLKGPFLILGKAVGDAFGSPQTQAAIRGLIDGFGKLVKATAPLFGPVLQAFLALGKVFMNLATVAMPELVKLFQQLSGWLTRIAGDTKDTAHLREEVHRLVTGALQLVGALGHVLGALLPLFTGQSSAGFLFIINAFAEILSLVVSLLNHMGLLGKLIMGGLGIAFILAKLGLLSKILVAVKDGTIGLKIAEMASAVAAKAMAAAQWLVNAATLAFPGTWITLAILAVIAVVVLIVTHFSWFKQAASDVWDALKSVWGWIKSNWETIGAILLAPFTPFIAIVKGAISVLGDLKNLAGGVIGGIGDFFSGGGGGKPKAIGGKADGGPVDQSGYYNVGERGPETVFLQRGNYVQPNTPHGQGEGGPQRFVIEATFVMPDGTVTARQSVIAAQKALAAR